MKTYKIAVIPGDGIGPEVVNEGLKVLKCVSQKHAFSIETTDFHFGGERYLRTGEILSDTEVQNFRAFDAIFLGGIGHPDVKPGILEKGILLKLRFDLDQYINLRPVKLFENVETPIKGKTPKDIDYIVFRENTGGLYTGIGEFQKKGTPDEVAIQSMVYSKKQVERCIRYAFEYLKKRHTDNPWQGLSTEEKQSGKIAKLTLCGKTNVLTYVFDLWQRVFDEVLKEYPMIITDYVHVDAMCIYMIENPARFNGIVTNNMFGDIITDLAAVTQGGMGVAPSGNINPEGVSMFEPVHGTAPSFTGQNVVNPIATILTVQIMLNALGETQAADDIEEAVKAVIKKMKSMLVGRMGYSTSEIGDMVCENIARK
ncbi:MAG: 3-isopropylmalate dehydrogenase [Candidatus Omnitrophica bacterium]|nr:3-isopropylmalate dehydrogenase [Candidatus Omnitrophota bacterium]